MADRVVRSVERVTASSAARRDWWLAPMRLSWPTRSFVLFCTLAATAYVVEYPGSGFNAVDVPDCYDPAKAVSGTNHFACYDAMAVHPRIPTAAPFAFRVLEPWIVHLIPVTAWIGFHIVTALCLAAAGVLLFDLIRRDLGTTLGLLALALFWMSGAVSLSLRSPGGVDPPLILFGVATMYLARRAGWWWAAGCVAIGISAHELTAMFLVPLVVAAWPQMRGRSLLLVAPAAIVYVALHFTPLLYGHVIAPYPALTSANLEMIRGVQDTRAGGLLQAAYQAAAIALGAIWLLAPAGWRRCPPFYRAMATAVIAGLAAFTIVADWDRLLSVTAVLVIPMVCCAFRRSSPAAATT